MKFLNLLAACLLAVAVVGCSEQSGTDDTPTSDPANVEAPGDTGDSTPADPGTGNTGYAGPADAAPEATEGEQP